MGAFRKIVVVLPLALMALVVARPAAAQKESLFCVGEKATGFKWEDGAWVVSNFNVDRDRFIVSPVDGSNEYNVTRLGERQPFHSCSRYVYNDFVSSRLVCGGLGSGISVDFNHLRYQEFYGIGYIDGMDREGNTPNITIGTCSVISQ